MIYRKLLISSFFIGGLLTATVADAQGVNNLESRLSRLENEMQTMSRAMFKGDVPPPQYTAPQDAQNAAAMEMRLGQMEEQMQRLTGRIEETQYQIRQMEQQISDFMAQSQQQGNNNISSSNDGQYQNDNIDNAYDDGDSETLSSGASDNGSEPYRLGTLNSNASTPAALYDEAFSYLQRNDYATAETTFRDFTSRYPDHSLVSNAKYWLGETFYARGDYTDASRAFARAFQDHPDSQKAPDMLLKLGMSLAKQGKTNEACLTLAELKKRYPLGPTSVMQTADEERQSLGCDS